jgi:hypothetical protein
MDILNKKFKYITKREHYGYADTWVLHSNEVVEYFKNDSEVPLKRKLKYIEVLRNAIYYIAKNRKLAEKQVVHYDKYNDVLLSEQAAL